MPRYTTISLEELSRSAAEEVTKSAQNWMAFLDTASNIYKYTFDEQLLIHVQRPGIRACATIDIWNDKMRRWLKRGCKGIAILDKSQPEVSLKYVYDIKDTYPLKDGGRTPYFWQLKEVQTEGLIRHLEDTYLFTVPGKALGEALYQVALENVREQFEEYYEEFRYGVENSFLEDLDELNQRKELRETMIYSVYYSLLKRCGLNPVEYMEAEDLTSITQFNTLEALTYLGTATSEICKPIFMDIAKAVWQMDREEYEKNQKKDLAKEEKASYNKFNTLIRESKNEEQSEERGRKDETGNSISDSSGRGLSDSSDHNRTDRQGHREIRENEEGLSSGKPQGNLPVSSVKRETGIPSSGNQSAGTEAARKPSGRAAEKESGAGQEKESNGVGTAHEHAGAPGRGKRQGSDYLQLSLFPTVEEQKKRARQAAGNRIPAAFSVSEEEIREALRTGSGYQNSLSRICVALSRIQEPEELAEFLQAEYQRGGKGLEINGHKIVLWYDRSGMSIAREGSARLFPERHLSWKEVGSFIADMYQKGEFTSEQIQVQAEVTQRQELAKTIYFIFRDGLHHIPERWGSSGEYEKSVFLIAAELSDRAKQEEILDGLKILLQRPASSGIPSWLFRNTKDAVKWLEYLHRDRIAPLQKRIESPQNERFITQDEIDSVLQAGGNVEGAAGRIYNYFSERHTAEEKRHFLSHEFGIDEKTLGIPGADHSKVWHDGKGIRLSKGSIQNQVLKVWITWEKAAKRVQELVETGQYFLKEESPKLRPAEQAQTEPQEEGKEPPSDIQADKRKIGGELERPEETKEIFREETVAELAAEEERNEPENPKENYYLEEVQGLDEGGPKEKFRKNLEALKVLKQCEAQNRPAASKEQEILAKYSGWGGLADAFDPEKENWKKEYQELKELLTEEEYQSARSTTLNAHYTPTYIIREMYGALERMGFRQGNILDPSMGTGRFFGMLPEKLRDSHLYGVELDSLTGRIAKQLYPQAEIEIMGYEKTNFPDDFFDVAISNVPFGNYSVADKKYNKQNFMIHDYFFQKALAQVRPGGVVAFITTKGTLDKASPEVRKALADKADLLGAVRLPNTAFKESARTEVTSDILFFKKRDTPAITEPEWVHLGQTENQLPINAYFAEHPEMVLGEMQEVSGPFGMEITCKPLEGEPLENQLRNALEKIQGEFTEKEWEDGLEEQPISIPADPEVQNYSFALHEGEVYYRVHSRMEKTTLPAATKERIKGMIALRDCTRKLINAQLEDQPDSEIKNLQAELNRLYDDFTKAYGLINSSANKRAFSDDASYCLLCSLENLDDEGKLKSKADMFTKRTIKKPEVVTSVDTASEALSVSISEKAGVDLEYMSELTGKEPKELCRELSGIIFWNPETKEWQNNDEYLSGNIRKKLKIAKEAAKEDADLEVNVQALEQVIPKDLTASEIDVRMGATWVEPEIYKQFMFELLQTPNYFQVGKDGMDVLYSALTGQWRVKGKGLDRGNIQAENTYGTKRANAYRIIEDTLNLKDTRVFDVTYDIEGKEIRTLNKEETMLAGQKQEAIKEAFREWVFKDQKRREKLCKTYNERFNSIRPREYDGSYLQFPGMNPEITLRPQQKDGAAHVILGDNTLLAHCVGAGKTFTMIASAMESKRLGLCQKNLFVVPNHLTEQWGSDILRLYPGAKVLVSTKKDFEPLNRKKFCSRIATGEYDCVVIGHTQFEKIPLSAERQKAIIQAQIDEITEGIEEVKSENGERYTIKQMEKTKKSLLARLERLAAQEKKDNVITFEQLGCDRLFVDESHYYKNLFLYTKMRNVGGIAQTEAQKSSDMFAKCQYLDELTGGKGITFATGTPISNSMTEMYTNMRYLQYNRLKELGLEHFDSWAAAFGETITAIELSPEGNGYRAKTRFARFFNLPELLAIFKEVADIKTADMLDLDTPEAVYENVITKPSAYQKEILQSLAERAEKVRNREVEPYQDNMLKITNDGRKLALDQRLLNEMLPEDENSKIAACAHKIYEIWERTKAEKSAQLLFSDLSTPKGKVRGTVEGESQEAEIFDNAYTDIRKKLTAMGVPAEEIAFIHQANTEIQKAELFAKVRSGQIRILLGSTSKMGAGTNVQDRLIALHHLDVPWRPSDIEQREGRIIRQGNENDKVYIYRYITENTFDAYSWQTIENKQKFIGQIMTSKAPVRSCEDIDESALTYAEVKALAAGNPYIKEKMTLDNDVAKLKALKANHTSQIYNLEDRIVKYYPEKLAALKEKEVGCQRDIECYHTNFPISKDVVSMELFGEHYTDKKTAGEALLAAFKKLPESDEWCPIGKYAGFDIELKFTSYCLKYEMRLKHVNQLQIELGRDAGGNLIRMNNVLASLPERLEMIQQELENTQNQLEQAKEEVKRPFAKEAELQEKMARLRELDAMLNMDQKEDSQNRQEEQTEEQQKEEEPCGKQSETEGREEKPSIHAKLRAYQSFVQKNGKQQPEAECPKRQAIL